MAVQFTVDVALALATFIFRIKDGGSYVLLKYKQHCPLPCGEKGSKARSTNWNFTVLQVFRLHHHKHLFFLKQGSLSTLSA